MDTQQRKNIIHPARASDYYQTAIVIITTRWSDHIQENNIQVKSRFGTYQL